MPRATPFTRLFAELMEDIDYAIDSDNTHMLIETCASMRRLMILFLENEDLQHGITDEIRNRITTLISRSLTYGD